MASLIYTSAVYDAFTGAMDFDTDTFYAMLLDNTYTPDKTHTKRSDLTADESSGTGYTAGGVAVTLTAAQDNTNTRVNVQLGAVTINSVTVSPRYVAYYKHRGGADTADNLVAVVDLLMDIIVVNGTFSLTDSTLRVQN